MSDNGCYVTLSGGSNETNGNWYFDCDKADSLHFSDNGMLYYNGTNNSITFYKRPGNSYPSWNLSVSNSRFTISTTNSYNAAIYESNLKFNGKAHLYRSMDILQIGVWLLLCIYAIRGILKHD